MSSDLKAQLQDAVKQAMRARERERLKTLRMATAAIKQREIDERIELDDAEVLRTLDKLVKQRRESEQAYREAGREELAETEAAERAILEEFLPQPLSDSELVELIDAAIAKTGAAGMQDMGNVMSELRPQVQGRADMKAVSAHVKARLQG